MSVVINSNYAATTAANNLAVSSSNLQRSLNRLSSGSKIVNPADDAGGLAVSMKLSAAAKRQGAANINVANEVSFLQTQDGVLAATGKILSRMSELKVMDGDITKSASDRLNYQNEFVTLQNQIIANSTEKFNGVNLFGTDSQTVGTTEDGTRSMDVPGANLLAQAAFVPYIEHFADLNAFGQLFSNQGTVSGGVLSLDASGSNPVGIITVSSYSGPLEINLQVRSIAPDFQIRYGLFAVTNTVPADSSWHDLKIIIDGSGNASSHLDGSSSNAEFNANVPIAFQQIDLTSSTGNTQVRNFSIESTGALGNVSAVAGAIGLDLVSLRQIDAAIEEVATYRAQNGASQSRLGFASELLTVNQTNLEAANSRITDVDVAQESTSLARYNILVQAGTSMLAQANQSAQSALKLIS
jgi:flagellin-like hook-associated protein FlgL